MGFDVLLKMLLPMLMAFLEALLKQKSLTKNAAKLSEIRWFAQQIEEQLDGQVGAVRPATLPKSLSRL